MFPSHVDGKDTLDYMLERTFFRPRDVIVFINECLELCAGRPKITAAIIKEAEGNYSLERLQSLANEWNTIYPDLMHTSRLLFNLKEHFELSLITQDFLGAKFEEIAYGLNGESADQITVALYSLYMTKNANFESIRNYIFREFYAVGLVGIKTGSTDTVSWTRQNNLSRLNPGQIRPTSTVHIHPMFHRALGVKY